MNSLSWMLYLADLAGSVSIIGSFIYIGCFVAGCAATCFISMSIDIENIGAREKRPTWATGWATGKKFFVASAIAAFIVIPVPGKETIYAIAASEMGENALKSETGGKALKALNAWLDRQIGNNTEAEAAK